MSLSYEQLEEILQEITSEGWRNPLVCFRDSSKNIPLVSQLAYNTDLSCLSLGKSQNSSSTLAQDFPFLGFLAEDRQTFIKNLWKEWQRSLVLGQVEYIYLPEALWQLFLKEKPQEFSLLQGETLESRSPFFEMWTKSPQASLCFLRVRDTRKPEEGSVDKGSFQDPQGRERFFYRDLGSFQKSSLANHQHSANFKQVTHIHRQRFLRVKKGIPVLVKWDESLTNPLPPQGICDQNQSSCSSPPTDLRPENLVVGVLWKNQEGSIEKC